MDRSRNSPTARSIGAVLRDNNSAAQSTDSLHGHGPELSQLRNARSIESVMLGNGFGAAPQHSSFFDCKGTFETP